MTMRATLFLLLTMAPGFASAVQVSISEQAHSICGNANGFATAYASGGTMPYTFEWSNGATTETAYDLAPGTYTVTVTDATMDQATAEVTIDELPTTLNLVFSGAGLHGCEGLCNGGRNISVGPLPANLAPPVSFWPPLDVDFGGAASGSYGQYTSLCPGQVLQFTVTDGTGCQLDVTDDWLPESSSPTPMSIVGVTPACGSLASGSVTIYAGLDATSPFAMVWEVVILNEAMQQVGGTISGLNPTAGQNIATREGLAAGNYFAKRYFSWHPEDCQDLVPFTIPDQGGNCGLLTGTAFVDHNLNCSRQFNEPWVPFSIIEVLPGPYYASTNGLGQYSVALPPGAYTVQQQSSTLGEHCIGAPIPFNITNGASTTVHHPDTALVPLDLSISLSSGAARPGFELQYGMSITNLTPAASGTISVTFTFDPTVAYISATPVPSSVVGNTITWNQSQLAAWESRYYSIRFQVPPNVGLLGYELIATANVSAANADSDLSNNTATNLRTITGAYDPNDKLAQTSSGSSSVWLIDEDEWIDYTIRFQNTGTDTAFHVVITDTLPSTLDPSTLVIGAASHTPFMWELRDQGTIRVVFPNIQLPDSNINEPRSHGFIGFRIRPHLPIAPGTVIENIANIYFDFNPPVITEPSVQVAEFSTGVGERAGIPMLHLMPNPTNGTLWVRLNGEGSGSGLLRIMAYDGRLLMEQRANGPITELDLAALVPGAYLIEWRDNNGQRLVERIIRN